MPATQAGTWQKITKLRKMKNPGCLELPAKLKSEAFFEQIRELCESGHSPLSLFGTKSRELGAFWPRVSSSGTAFRFSGFVLLPSLSRDFPAFQIFERELFEEHKITPQGHPWLKPVRHPSGDIYHDHNFLSSASGICMKWEWGLCMRE